MKKKSAFNSGYQFGDYVLGSPISAGQDGEVWEAKKLSLHGKRFAVKFINSIEDADKVNRFKREIRILASLNHQNIVSIVDSGNTQNPATGKVIPFYVMDLIEKTKRMDVILQETEDGLLADIYCTVFRQVCSGLAEAHVKEVTHGDLKPSNILIVYPELATKITDFGFGLLPPEESRPRDEYPGSSFRTPPGLGKYEADIYKLGRTFKTCLIPIMPRLKPAQVAILTSIVDHLISEPSQATLNEARAFLEGPISWEVGIDQYLLMQPGNTLSKAILPIYLKLALEHKWPVLRLVALFYPEAIQILRDLSFNTTFRFWESSLNLYLSICPGELQQTAKEIEEPLEKLGRTPWRVVDRLLEATEAATRIPSRTRLKRSRIESQIAYVEMLGSFYESRPALGMLLAASHSKEAIVRRAAANQLGRHIDFATFATIDRLFELLDDEDKGVQAEAISSIGNLTEQKSDSGTWLLAHFWIGRKNSTLTHKLGPPYVDDQYEQILPVEIQSKSEYVKQQLQGICLEYSEALFVTGFTGGIDVLAHLLSNYRRVEHSDEFQYAYATATNLIDERLFGEKIYRPEMRDLPITNRWWL